MGVVWFGLIGSSCMWHACGMLVHVFAVSNGAYHSDVTMVGMGVGVGG